MRTFTGGTFVAVAFLALGGLAPSTAAAEPVADFYRGKSISMIIATAPGGDYDLRARLISRHMGRHIPGNPTIVPRNMPGGVGIQAMNFMANVAPKDGTSIHAIMQNMSTHQALGGAGVEFDTRKFFWIGNTTDTPNVINSWHTTGIQTIQDVMTRELGGRRARAGDELGLLSEGAERAGGHQVQDRLGLSRAAMTSTSRWSAARSAAVVRIRGPRGKRPSRTGCVTRRYSSSSNSP